MRSVLAVAILMITSACSSVTPGVEGQWRLTAIVTDGSVQEIPRAAQNRVSVNMSMTDGFVQTGMQCNRAQGTYEYDPDTHTLTGDGWIVTLMACINAEDYESAIVGMLGSESVEVTLLKAAMLWTSGDRTLTFVRTAEQ